MYPIIIKGWSNGRSLYNTMNTYKKEVNYCSCIHLCLSIFIYPSIVYSYISIFIYLLDKLLAKQQTGHELMTHKEQSLDSELEE